MTFSPDFDMLRDALMAELRETLTSVDKQALDQFRGLLREAPRIFIAGKGRSGLMMRAFAMRLMHLNRPVYVVDYVTTPGIRAGDLLVIGSGSGRTPSLVHYATLATNVGAQIALITGAKASPIGNQATCVVSFNAATPKIGAAYDKTASIQPMGAALEQTMLLLLDLVIVQLMRELSQDTDEMFTRHANLE